MSASWLFLLNMSLHLGVIMVNWNRISWHHAVMKVWKKLFVRVLTFEKGIWTWTPFGEVGKVKNFTVSLKQIYFWGKKENLRDLIYYLTVYAHYKYFGSLDVTLCAYKADGAVTQTYCFWVLEPLQLSNTIGKHWFRPLTLCLCCTVICHRDWMLSQKALIPLCLKRQKNVLYVITHHYLSLAWYKPSCGMV